MYGIVTDVVTSQLMLGLVLLGHIWTHVFWKKVSETSLTLH